jgi:hypothetical protein
VIKLTKEDMISHWNEKFNEFKKSGKSKASWCRENNINIKTFGNWHTKFSKLEKQEMENNNKSTGWVSIKVKDVSPESIICNDVTPDKISTESTLSENRISNKPFQKSIIVVKIGKASIEVNNGFDKNLLYDVTKILGELC